MKPIIDFLKKNLSIIIIGVVLLFFSVSGIVDKCNSKQIDDTMAQVDVNAIRRNLIDSMASLSHKKYIAAIDSVNSIREADRKVNTKKIAVLNKENDKLRAELDELYVDSADMDLPTCIKIAEKQRDVIINRDSVVKNQSEQIVSYQMTLTDLNIKYESQLNETIRTQEMYAGCETDNDMLRNTLEKQNTWWRRNEKWVYTITAILGTAFILK